MTAYKDFNPSSGRAFDAALDAPSAWLDFATAQIIAALDTLENIGLPDAKIYRGQPRPVLAVIDGARSAAQSSLWDSVRAVHDSLLAYAARDLIDADHLARVASAIDGRLDAFLAAGGDYRLLRDEDGDARIRAQTKSARALAGR